MLHKRRIVNLKVLPGELLDGTGRVCIHLFVQDDHGSFIEPYVLHPAVDDANQLIRGQLVTKPTRGRLACNPKRVPMPVTRNGVTTIISRTDDSRAVTCPKCIASKDYMMATELLTTTEMAR